jgi:hypothetical protein
MRTLVERGCGLDAHQATVVACLLMVFKNGRIQKQGNRCERLARRPASGWADANGKSAIHSASFTSVLQPGTFFTCCAVATTISKAYSKTA